MRSIGVSLYNELILPELKDKYWKIRDSIKSVQIYSNEPWIPWEIIKPSRKLVNGNADEDLFFCERFSFSRWLIGKRRLTKEGIKKVKVVVPYDTKLLSSLEELDFIERFGNNNGIRGFPRFEF